MNNLRWIAAAFVSLTAILARLGAVAAAVAVVGMIGHTLVEIVLRGVFSTSTFALDEYVGYGIAAATTLGAANALESGSLIRVTLLFPTFERHPRLHRALDIATALLASALLAAIDVFFLRSAVRNFERSTVSDTIMATPLWVPEALVVVGLAVLALRFVGLAVDIVLQGRLSVAAHTVEDSIKMQGT